MDFIMFYIIVLSVAWSNKTETVSDGGPEPVLI